MESNGTSSPRIGLQLWTVRRACERDLAGVLDAAAAMGCDGVELCGLFGRSTGEVARVLERTGLAACSAHVGLDDLERHLPREADQAQALGYTRLVVPWVQPPRTAAQAADYAARIRRAAERVAERGLALGYHNHDFEFAPLESPAGGPPAPAAPAGTLWDAIEPLPADLLFLEPDLGWLWYAGVTPCEFLKKHRGRCPLAHVKDFSARRPGAFCPVGEGAVPYGVVVAHAIWEGVQWLIAEQDEPGELTELQAAERCVRNLRGLAAGATRKA